MTNYQIKNFSSGKASNVALLDNSETPDHLKRLCVDLSIPALSSAGASQNQIEQFQFLLIFKDGALYLQDRSSGSRGVSVKADFLLGSTAWRAKTSGARQPMARAAGIADALRERDDVSVIDATAGLGRDSLFFLSLGCRVTAVERSPSVFALLADARERAIEQQQTNSGSESNFDLKMEAEREKTLFDFSRLTLVCEDSAEYISRAARADDIIYIDPMFPERKKKSALPKKEMAMLRDLLGEDIDRAELLKAALDSPARRVVVKLPPEAEPIISGVSHSVKSKLVRFDVYRRQ